MKNERMGFIERLLEVKGRNGRVDRMCYMEMTVTEK